MGLGMMLKETARSVYVPLIEYSPTVRVMSLLAAGRLNRNTTFVKDGYEQTWSQYRARLESAATLDEWLFIKGHDDAVTTFHIDGKLFRRQRHDFNPFNMGEVMKALKQRFPQARSVTEYGCGVGRNLLRLKRELPHLQCRGYELAQAGVDIGRAAAKKFGLDVEYAQLDYVHGGPKDFVFGTSDVAFTMFSLEQLPYTNLIAAKNIVDHVRLGSIHMEPVSENYPLSWRGLLGRVYSEQVNYLKNFDAGVRTLPLKAVHCEVYSSAHNPLMFPSLYVLEK